jgi:hypothetical protein
MEQFSMDRGAGLGSQVPEILLKKCPSWHRAQVKSVSEYSRQRGMPKQLVIPSEGPPSPSTALRTLSAAVTENEVGITFDRPEAGLRLKPVLQIRHWSRLLTAQLDVPMISQAVLLALREKPVAQVWQVVLVAGTAQFGMKIPVK